MPANQRKFMLCTGECVFPDELPAYPDSHILGELRYVTDENRKVTALAVYEQSVGVDDVPASLPLIRAELLGDARRIRCTKCAKGERWEAGKAHIQALVSRVLKLREVHYSV